MTFKELLKKYLRTNAGVRFGTEINEGFTKENEGIISGEYQALEDMINLDIDYYNGVIDELNFILTQLHINENHNKRR